MYHHTRAVSAGGTGLGSGADPSRTRRGVAAMRTAARAGRVDVLAAVLAEDRSLAIAANEANAVATPLFEAVAAGERAAVALLLSQGADPNASSGERGPPLLHAAAWGEDTILAMLVTHGADVRATDTWGYTALHYACEVGHVVCVRTLMEHGGEALLNTRTREGRTPLQLCKDHATRVALVGEQAATRTPIVGGNGSADGPADDPPLSARVLRFAKKLELGRGDNADAREADEEDALIGKFDGGLDNAISSDSASSKGSRRRGHRRANSTHLKDILKFVTGQTPEPADAELRSDRGVADPGMNSRRASLSVEVANPAGSTPPLLSPMGAVSNGRPQGTSAAERGSAHAPVTPGTMYETDALNAPGALLDSPVAVQSLSQLSGDEMMAGDGGHSPTLRPSNVNRGSSAIAEQEAAAAKLLAGADGVRASENKENVISWARGQLLGEGAYGKVYQGLNTQTGQLMAVKEIAVADVDGRAGMATERLKSLASLEHEIELYKRLAHRHIVRYIGMQRDEQRSNLHVFLEFVPGGSIASMLQRFGHFSEQLVRLYTRQLLLGLEYLHGRRVIHRDLKGANVLIDGEGVVKLADFGASTAFEQTNLSHGFKSIRGSVYWMAPEVMKGTGYGRRADIWSVGCTVIEMITANHPWPELDNGWAAMFHIAKSGKGPPIPPECSDLCRSFLEKCFVLDPRQRATATDLLSHPFVATIPSVLSELESARGGKQSLELSL